jgi:hypothetical protein
VRELAQLSRGARQFGRGPAGPQAGVVWLREKRPALEETTDQLVGTFPFVAGSALPYFGQYHGIDRLSGAAFGWDGPVGYERQLISNPCIVIYGLIGSGKSMGAKSMLWRGLPFGRKFAVPGDIRGEYARLCAAAGGSPIVLGPGSPMRLSPLASPPRPPHVPEEFWRETVATHRATTLTTLAKAALQRPLSESEKTALDLALADATDGGSRRWARSRGGCSTRLQSNLSTSTSRTPTASAARSTTSRWRCGNSFAACSPVSWTSRPPRPSTPADHASWSTCPVSNSTTPRSPWW